VQLGVQILLPLYIPRQLSLVCLSSRKMQKMHICRERFSASYFQRGSRSTRALLGFRTLYMAGRLLSHLSTPSRSSQSIARPLQVILLWDRYCLLPSPFQAVLLTTGTGFDSSPALCKIFPLAPFLIWPSHSPSHLNPSYFGLHILFRSATAVSQSSLAWARGVRGRCVPPVPVESV
jgi:hypothetical protein